MNTAIDRINATVQDFTTQHQFENWLFELGRIKPTHSIRQKSNFVRGCQVDVWIALDGDDLLFDCDSAYIRGLCVLIGQVLSTAEDPNQIAFSDFANVTKYIPVLRKRGFQKLLNKAQTVLTSTQDVL